VSTVTIETTDFLAAAREFMQQHILPQANQSALAGQLPDGLIQQLAARRLLGTMISQEFGGLGLGYGEYGELTRLIGYGCSSLRSLLTVHDMVSYAIQKFGSIAQKQNWLPALAKGNVIGAFVLTEENQGSSFEQIKTTLTEKNGSYSLSGNKVWISYGQVADLLLVFAKLTGDLPVALLVPSDSVGIHITPIQHALGLSASMLAEIHFDDVSILPEQLLGKPGIGLNFIASQCLTLGRYSVACGSLAIIDACLQATQEKVLQVRPDGGQLIDFQLISGMVSDMIANRKMAQLLCKNAGEKLAANFFNAIEDVMIAKYMTAKLATSASNDALQIHGAAGHRQESSLRRYWHDAKVNELIEGSNEVMRAVIGKTFIGSYDFNVSG
jgi:glutaryl-CoA dehydrogenase (non-decarboxylating)